VNIFTSAAESPGPPGATEGKLFAGARLRRLRLSLGLTQTRMAADLGLSVSYLNLLERNQRPLSAAVLLKLASAYDVDIRTLTAHGDSGLAELLARRLAEAGVAPSVGRAELREFAEQHDELAAALLKLRAPDAAPRPSPPPAPFAVVRDHLLERGNHFPALEASAEALADELRLSGLALDAALAERLRLRHALVVRVLPTEVMPGALRRFDLHNRQLQLSEALDTASRTFQMAVQLASLEARELIEAEVAQAGPALATAGPFAARLLAHNLAGIWAAALMMPYGRFQAAAESLGYDLELLQARFGAGFEQVAHRLTTLQRPGARGIPFLMLRADRAGQVSKRLSPARLPFATEGGTCPLWVLWAAFAQPGQILTQAAELETGERIFTIARTVRPQLTAWGAARPSFAIALVCSLDHARGLVYAAGRDLDSGPFQQIGPGCTRCWRPDCRQRSAPPQGAALELDPMNRGATPYRFQS
jgi:predicted transcriptional regulator/transcriptional regulator with XRE-family HTH domain